MIQIFADGVLTYDSRLEDYDLQGLKITTGLNKGGTAEITMPASHPAYKKYIEYRTIVEVYRDGALRFRGRALYPEDDFNNNRTVMCEGELCFLQDGVSRPYRYEDTPENIFTDVVAKYNAQVDGFKQFKIGGVDVSDTSILLENEEAETVLDTINKLLELCGGCIEFTTDTNGDRVINWVSSVGNANQQTIEAGENLFDFSRSGANTDLATALIPYGAKSESTGTRLTIADVNASVDYITDDAAAAIRGTIVKTATWDDITDPEILLQKARQYLDEHKLIVTSLTLSALDLSYIDKSIESFKLGDTIRVTSRAHNVDESFQLVELSEDLLNPAQSYITMGKEVRTLTSLDVAGDSKSQRELQKAVSTVKTDIKVGNQQTATEIEGKVTEQLTQNAEDILQQVAKTYATKEELEGYATKEELDGYATSDELGNYATKEELTTANEAMASEITRLEARIAALEAAK